MSHQPPPDAFFDAGDGNDITQLAGEYVLGTLSLQERKAVAERLQHDAALRTAVDDWEQQLLPLTTLVAPVAPSGRLWWRIMRSLESAPQPLAAAAARAVAAGSARARAAPPRPWWRDAQSLRLWRGLSAGGFAAAAVMAALVVATTAPPTPATRYMVVLVAPDNQAPGWIVQTGAARQIELIPLERVEIPVDKALQLWTKADGWAAPISLGLVVPGQRLSVPMDQLPGVQANQLFELTLEPKGGSPTGLPTGPIHYIGRSVNVT